MKFSEFLETFKGNLVSVKDGSKSYNCMDEPDIADRDVDQITNNETGVYVKLKDEILIPLVDIINIYSGEKVAIKFDKRWIYMTTNEARCGYKDCAVIKIVYMDNVLRLVLKRGVYRSFECDLGESL